MPIKPDKDVKLPEITNALTVMLTDKDKIYWYYNAYKPDTTTLQLTDFSATGIHKLLLDYNKDTKKNIDVNQAVQEQAKRLEKREISDTTYKRMRIEIMGAPGALTVLIKTDDKAKYKNVVDMLDELNICNIGKYAIVDISQPEFDLLKKTKGE